MPSTHIAVQFGEHVSAGSVASMRAGLNAHGVVLAAAQPRQFLVEVFRATKLPGLLVQLMEWERYGFLTYEELSEPLP